MTSDTPEEGRKPTPADAKLPEARLKPSATVKKPRLHARLKQAIEAMAYEGLSIPFAAQRVGMSVDSLKAAFRKTHVKQSYNQLVRDIRDGAGQEAYMRINHLSQTANSENVKLDANRWIAGVDNIAPIKRVEGRMSHTHVFKGFDFDEPDPKDITPPDD